MGDNLEKRKSARMVDFSKYQGLGNDFIVFDGYQKDLPELIRLGDPSYIKRICDRRFGIGADGIILLLASSKYAIKMKIFNSDGTQAEMCGNGIRCLVRFLLDNNDINIDEDLTIETLAGPIRTKINKNKEITVDMGLPLFKPSMIPTTLSINDYGIPEESIVLEGETYEIYAAGMGNPHMIIFVDDLTKLDLEELGQKLENHHSFPSKTNVHFVHINSRTDLDVIVWERGCGKTLACGTGACAVAAVSNKLGICDKNVTVNLPGGTLAISWPDPTSNIYMTGAAEYVFSGKINIDSFRLS